MIEGDTVDDSGAGHHDEAYCPACNQSYTPETDKCPRDGTKLVRFKAQKDEMIGRVLDGRFEVRTPLGQGGMGTVYRALQVSVDREVAIKVIHTALANDRQAAKRFLREARLASRLNQPNIVNVIDFGQTEDGVLYLVMELLRGRTLATELGGQRRLTVRRTMTIALQLCDALEAAHAQGIVHRDLKPGNIVILDDPPGRDLLKVLDFGLAKSLATDTTSQVTHTNSILGTPVYMSPEQVEGKPSDQRADLYSLGCILFELLAGTPPFVDTSVNLLLAKHLSDPPPPLPPHVPPTLRALIETMLSKQPEDRIQTAGEVRATIQGVLERGLQSASEASDTMPDVDVLDPALAMTMTPPPGHREPPPAVAQKMSAVSARAIATASAPPPRRRSRGLVIALIAVVGIAGGFAAIKLTRRDGAPGPAATPAVVVDAMAPMAGGPDAAPPAADAPPAPTDAPAPPIDARPGRDSRPERHRPPRDAAPAGRARDAGTASTPSHRPDAEPDVDFYPKKP